MSNASNVMLETEIRPPITQPVVVTPARALYWCIRRELWEEVGLNAWPRVVAAVAPVGFATSTVVLPPRRREAVAVGAGPLPRVIRSVVGGGACFGAQHSQSLENWAMAVPGLKVVAPSTPADAKGLLAAAIRDPDPVLFFEQKSLYGIKGEVPDGEHVESLGAARVLRDGKDCTIVALAAMVPRALAAAAELESSGIHATVVDVRCLVPLDTRTILSAVSRTGRLFTVEENPRLCGWGAEIASIAAEECFDDLDGPIVRLTTPHVPLPAAPPM